MKEVSSSIKVNMRIRKDACHLKLFAYHVGRPKTEVASILKFNISYIAFASILVEKRIYKKVNLHYE